MPRMGRPGISEESFIRRPPFIRHPRTGGDPSSLGPGEEHGCIPDCGNDRLSATSLEVLQQNGGRECEAASDADDIQKSQVALASLYATEVRSMQSGAVGQLLLRDAEAISLDTHALAELDQVFCFLLHRANAVARMLMGLQPISSTAKND